MEVPWKELILSTVNRTGGTLREEVECGRAMSSCRTVLSLEGDERRLPADGRRMPYVPDIGGSTVDGSVSLTAKTMRLSLMIEISDTASSSTDKDVMVGVSGGLPVEWIIALVVMN